MTLEWDWDDEPEPCECGEDDCTCAKDLELERGDYLYEQKRDREIKQGKGKTMSADDIYLSHIDQPYGKLYADAVGRFQEGFLRDKVCKDVDEAFARAVQSATKFVFVFKARAEAVQ